jgi:phytoene synthase
MSQQISQPSLYSGLLRMPYDMLRPVYERTSIHRSVIDEVQDEDLRHAYTHCRNITRTHAKTFYLATRFLPNEKQRSIFAIYGLCRYVDDLIDESEDLITQSKINAADARPIMDEFQRKLEEAYQTKQSDNLILMAFTDTLNTFHIPMKYPLELMEGVCMDLHTNRYQTFDQLYGYCYKVASVVGLMTSEVFGYEDPKAIGHAIDLGIAMQLTNILRDIGEDLERNRIYLPLEELERFGLTEKDLFDHVIDDRFKALMDFQIDRARRYYASADEGIAMLNADSRLPVILARENYSRILDVIERNIDRVYKHRAYLTTSQKLKILPKAWWQMTTR